MRQAVYAKDFLAKVLFGVVPDRSLGATKSARGEEVKHHDELQQAHPEVKLTPFIEKFDELEVRCRDCGYKLTDEERKKLKDVCVFCPHDYAGPERFRFPIFLGQKIHNEKVLLRGLFDYSLEVRSLEHAIRLLEDNHAEEVFPKLYSDEKNAFQIQHAELKEKLAEIKAECKRVYYAALGNLGARYTRELDKSKKKRLLAVLREYNRNHKEKHNDTTTREPGSR
jgi:hypothetical protein